MKLSTREDIDAPIEDVYTAVTNFDGFERQMLRRGIDVVRDESHPTEAPGARWKAAFNWRGRKHDVESELVTITPGEGFAIESKSGGVVCMSVVDLVPLSKSRTRLLISLDLRPTTLPSRLFVQSLKLAKGSLERRFKGRVSTFAKSLEV